MEAVLTTEQIAGLAWLAQIGLNHQDDYLSRADPGRGHGAEWPKIATQKICSLTAAASALRVLGQEGLGKDCEELAQWLLEELEPEVAK